VTIPQPSAAGNYKIVTQVEPRRRRIASGSGQWEQPV